MPLTRELRRSPELTPLQARRRGSRRDLARVTELMWRIENGHHVRQQSLDYFNITLCPALTHLAVPRVLGIPHGSTKVVRSGQPGSPAQPA